MILVIKIVTKIIFFTYLILLPFFLNKNILESFSGFTMGSTYSIKYVKDNTNLFNKAYIKEEVEKILSEIDLKFSTYRSDSLVSTFNKLPTNSCMFFSKSILNLFKYILWLSIESKGAYDITIHNIMNIWGFNNPKHDDSKFKIPSIKDINIELNNIGYKYLYIKNNCLCKKKILKLI